MINLLNRLQRGKYNKSPECDNSIPDSHSWIYPPEMDRRICEFCNQRQIRGWRCKEDENQFFYSAWFFKPYKGNTPVEKWGKEFNQNEKKYQETANEHGGYFEYTKQVLDNGIRFTYNKI